MLNRLIYAFVVFTMLLTIPNISLNFFEKKINFTGEAMVKDKDSKNRTSKLKKNRQGTLMSLN